MGIHSRSRVNPGAYPHESHHLDGHRDASNQSKRYVPPEQSTPVNAQPEKVRRPIEEVLEGQQTLEGAGVLLKRAFGAHQVPRLDPFLMLDDFRSDNPEDYLPGFPWHPHRGIETVTYMTDGYVEHGDSLGNKGRIGPGDVQWMTAGSGIIHSEMPKGRGNLMGGMQLWVNLPAREKMGQPRYQEYLANTVPRIEGKGAAVKVVAGEYGGVSGPVRDVKVNPQFLDISLEPGTKFRHDIPCGHRSFAYVLEGQARFDEGADHVKDHNLVILRDGDYVDIETTSEAARLILVSGRPLKEPVAWMGPIVMNTQKELEAAQVDLQNGTFIKHRANDEGDATRMRTQSAPPA